MIIVRRLCLKKNNSLNIYQMKYEEIMFWKTKKMSMISGRYSLDLKNQFGMSENWKRITRWTDKYVKRIHYITHPVRLLLLLQGRNDAWEKYMWYFICAAGSHSILYSFSDEWVTEYFEQIRIHSARVRCFSFFCWFYEAQGGLHKSFWRNVGIITKFSFWY